ncbi:DNA translocase FtsK [Ahrensia sp. 13_GOM-1096m]|uniref:DNA translocase FtsK n=1 Tax=Ahrensia sp. 13_GOM-1096m TaxID=1380380 RepID=UPI000478C0B7|nr:DNA translocase FtsK [Ahrensia sp. 13_GOM-1096m]
MQVKRDRFASADSDFDAYELPQEAHSSKMTHLLWRQAEIAGGLVLLLFVVFVIAALATWNAADPSFSHATDSPVTNAMGFAGSAVSDLLIQFFGLASLAVLVPLLFKSYALVRGNHWNLALRRLGAWLAGSLLFAAFLGCFPTTQAWPMPTGLGGVMGDMVLKIPGLFLGGYPQGFFAFLVGAVLFVPALWSVAIASGFLWKQRAHNENDMPHDAMAHDEGEGFVRFVSLGAIMHGFYSAKAAIRRRLPQRAKPAAKMARRAAHYDEPSFEASAQGHPVDPDMGYAAPDSYEVDDANYSAEYAGENWDGAEDWAPQVAPNEVRPDATPRVAAPAQIAPASGGSARVEPAAPKPKPSVRVQREAQPSLIKDNGYELPPVHLLNEPKNTVRDESLSPEALEQNARVLEGVLEDFGVKGEIIHVRPGPVVTMYELEPAPGIKSSRVIGLAEDIARSMSAIAARVAVVPGRNAIGIELPNNLRETVYFREMIASANYDNSKAKLAMALGKTINGEPVIADLAKMPHLLVAGTTGSGKSVAINTMLLSLLYKLSPAECRLIMIDPKMLELSVYDGIPHLLTPVVTDPKKAVVALKWTVREMEQRYKNMAKLGVRNIDGFNTRVKETMDKGEEITRTVQTGFDRETGEAIYETEALDLEHMPYIVVVIDEMADLMMVAGKEIEGAVQRLAQMARAAGIHVVMATQRPSVDVITGTIKANFPTRISFQVTSKIDSRTILGEMGAEQLLGMGDMLYMAGGGRIQRVHGPFVSDEEVEEIVKHLKLQGVPQYLEAVTEDDDEDDGDSGSGGGNSAGGMGDSEDPYDQAVAVVLRDRKASTSYIQRRLGIGYNRAASLIERMEDEGVIGPANHAGKRDILVPSEEEQQMGGMM